MASIERSSVSATVARHLGEILEIDPSTVTEDKTFVDDLGADSIALIELVDALEVEFSATLDGFAFDDDELSGLKTVRDAVIAMEDSRFYDHAGVDPIGLSRALVVNAIHGGTVQGGSTLTQQLAKNLFLDQERTWERKYKEAFLALALEHRLGKDEILARYLSAAELAEFRTKGNVIMSITVTGEKRACCAPGECCGDTDATA